MARQHLFPGNDVPLKIYREFREANPPTEPAFVQWLEQTNERYGIPISDIRAILANQESQFIRKARNVVDTEAEAVARTLGATLAKAIAVLDEQLTAEKHRIFTDAKGRIVLDPCGNCAGNGKVKYEGEDRHYRKCKFCDGKGGFPTYLKTPDNAARQSAVDKLLKIYGAFKPDRIEIDGHITYQELPVSEIGARLKRLIPKIINLQAERIEEADVVEVVQQNGNGAHPEPE